MENGLLGNGAGSSQYRRQSKRNEGALAESEGGLNYTQLLPIKTNTGKRYGWEEADILIIKITVNVLVLSLFRTFRPSSGAIFNEQRKLTRISSK